MFSEEPAMFGFLRNGQRVRPRARHTLETDARSARADDRLPDRPSLDGYVVHELPDRLADLLVRALQRRTA
jgi:hypothetical protein